MTYFPQANPSKRARRVRLPGAVVVAVRSEGRQPVQAKLHEVSLTGGLLVLSKALEQGDFVEVAFQTSQVPFAVWLSFSLQDANQNRAVCKPFGSSPWRMKTTPDCE